MTLTILFGSPDSKSFHPSIHTKMVGKWWSWLPSGQIIATSPQTKLGGGFKYFLFSPEKLGKWSNLTSIFFEWVGLKPPTRKGSFLVSGAHSPDYFFSDKKSTNWWRFFWKVRFFCGPIIDGDRQVLQCTTQPNYCPDPSPLLELGARFGTTELEVSVGFCWGSERWGGTSRVPRDQF